VQSVVVINSALLVVFPADAGRRSSPTPPAQHPPSWRWPWVRAMAAAIRAHKDKLMFAVSSINLFLRMFVQLSVCDNVCKKKMCFIACKKINFLYNLYTCYICMSEVNCYYVFLIHICHSNALVIFILCIWISLLKKKDGAARSTLTLEPSKTQND
jgi:hypothetical protein